MKCATHAAHVATHVALKEIKRLIHTVESDNHMINKLPTPSTFLERMKFSSLVASEVTNMTPVGAASKENFVKITTCEQYECIDMIKNYTTHRHNLFEESTKYSYVLIIIRVCSTTHTYPKQCIDYAVRGTVGNQLNVANHLLLLW